MWINLYDPETKEQSKEWRHSGSPCPKTFQTQKSASRLMASVFWDKDGILLVDYLEKGEKVTDSYCTALLDKVKQALVSKQQGNCQVGSLFLQDNISSRMAAITHCKLADLHFEVLKLCQFTSSGPFNLPFVPNLKKHLKWMKLSTTENAMSAADD
jgi:hypothetical protein